MTESTRRSIRGLISFAAAGGFALAMAGSVLASHVHVSTTAPGEGSLGEMVRIPVALQAEDGAPLEGTTVVYYLRVVFAGVTGEAEIGRAVTDATGVATLAYRPRVAGHNEIRIEYVTPGEGAVEVVSTAFDVTGAAQLYRSSASVDIPGVNGGLLMAVLGTVWSILLWVVLRFVVIARAGGKADAPGRPDAA